MGSCARERLLLGSRFGSTTSARSTATTIVCSIRLLVRLHWTIPPVVRFGARHQNRAERGTLLQGSLRHKKLQMTQKRQREGTLPPSLSLEEQTFIKLLNSDPPRARRGTA